MLQLEEGAELRVSSSLDRVDELGRITREAALSVGLPDTPHNRRVLAKSHPSVLSGTLRDNLRYAVRVYQHGAYEPMTTLQLLSYEPRKGYEAEPLAEDWQDGLTSLRLTDLQLTAFPWTQPAIEAAWQAPRGSMDVLPALAHWGSWQGDGTVTLRDLRLLVSARHLLSQMFAAIGWSFTCPHLEVGNGRAWYLYLLGSRWHFYPGKETPHYSRVSLPAGVTTDDFYLDVLPWNVEQNVGQAFKPSGFGHQAWHYTLNRTDLRSLYVDVEIQVDALVDSPPLGYSTTFEVWIFQAGAANYPVKVYKQHILPVYGQPGGGQQRIQRTLNATIVVEFPTNISTAVEEYATPFSVAFQYNGAGLNPTVEGLSPTITFESVTVQWRPDPPYYQPGDVVDVAAGMDPETPAMDVLTGIAQLINGKFVTDLAAKTVRLDVPFSYRTVNEPIVQVPGFYVRNGAPIDLRPQVVEDSLRWTDPSRLSPRYAQYGYSRKADDAVTDADLARWGQTVDTGFGDEGQPADHKQKFFAPTANVQVPGEFVGGSGINVPAIWEGEGAERATEVEPRILNFYGMISGGGETVYRLEGQARTAQPFMSLASLPLNAETLQLESLAFAGSATDLYALHYAQEVIDRGRPVQLLVWGGDRIFDNIDFTRPVLVTFGDSAVEMQPVKKMDHSRGTDLPFILEGWLLK